MIAKQPMCLKILGTGHYYVTQTINGIESVTSNIVDIVDIDRPYITLMARKNFHLFGRKANYLIMMVRQTNLMIQVQQLRII